MMKFVFILLLLLLGNSARCQSIDTIGYDFLPVKVKQHFTKHYPHYIISQVYRRVDLSNITSFEVNAMWPQELNLNLLVSLTYNSEGKLVKRKNDKEIFYTGREPSRPEPQEGGHQH